MALLHHCVHQTHIKHNAKTILLMLIKRHFRLKINNIITILYSSNKNGVKSLQIYVMYNNNKKTAACIIGK